MKGKIVLAALIWLMVLGIGVLFWKYWLEPEGKRAEVAQQEAKQEEVMQKTEGTSRYRTEVAIGLDSFSGYAVFRSSLFKDDLAKRGVRVQLVDDQGNYEKRLADLEQGTLQMALFPADALIQTSAKLGRLPATIVAIVDESKGADAILAYKSKYPEGKKIDALNAADTRFVLVGNSPSETLARVVMQDFHLPNLAGDPFLRVSGMDAVQKAYRDATPATSQVYVAWEPYVSQMLASNDQLYRMMDSSQFTGYIVDTLVVSRDYLLKHEEEVRQVMESYFRALHGYSDPRQANAAERFRKLILEDAKQTGMALGSKEEAEKLADAMIQGIQWKNTMENFAHFAMRGGSLVHIEDMLARIMGLLKSSGAIKQDPTEGKLSRLFFDRPLAQLMSQNFYPGLQDEAIREQETLPALSDKQWELLVPIGTLSVPELAFQRGSSKLTETSSQTLQDLANRLRSWPDYYLLIRGNAANTGGNQAANEELAAKRAVAVLEYLQSLGIPTARMRAMRGEVAKSSSVTFVVGQLPY